MKPFDRDAVARLVEHAARLAGHASKLTLVVEQLRRRADRGGFLGRQSAAAPSFRADVEGCDRGEIRRAARLRDRAQEAILDKTCADRHDRGACRANQWIECYRAGGLCFGRPTRITCRVRPGSGKVVDIEREVELGGPIHSKGVLILSGFLAGRYALDTPMSLFASLVFEQSYGGVEGDSASSAELYALLSALAELPLRQDLAVTGSVNQHGAIQAIGGVNEKIEGFFDICQRAS